MNRLRTAVRRWLGFDELIMRIDRVRFTTDCIENNLRNTHTPSSPPNPPALAESSPSSIPCTVDPSTIPSARPSPTPLAKPL